MTESLQLNTELLQSRNTLLSDWLMRHTRERARCRMYKNHYLHYMVLPGSSNDSTLLLKRENTLINYKYLQCFYLYSLSPLNQKPCSIELNIGNCIK